MKLSLRAALLLLFSAGLSRAAVSSFYFQPGPNGSELTSTIGTGSSPNFDFRDWGHGTTSIFSDIGVASNVFGVSTGADLFLVAPDRLQIQPGFYVAPRAGLQPLGTAGFTWIYNGVEPNTSISLINVLEIAYDSNGSITKLAIDFTQYEEAPANTPVQNLSQYHSGMGSLRFNSDIPLNVPEPATPLVVALGAVAAVFGGRRRR